MFSSWARLQRRCGKKGVGRFDYLQQLVTEFQDTTSQAEKEQVLANLANFCYDPINYGFLNQLNVCDLFLDILSSEPTHSKLVEYAIGGLCNFILDLDCRNTVIRTGGISLIARCLSSSSEATVLSAVTTLYYLNGPDTVTTLSTSTIIDFMERLKRGPNARLRNLATIYLEDVASPAAQEATVSSIPLPHS